jgi:hypothetical protein
VPTRNVSAGIVIEGARLHFDTVQMPIDIMDAHFRSFSQAAVSPGAGGGIAILKSFGDNIVLKSGSVEPMDCLRYSLNIPLSVLIPLESGSSCAIAWTMLSPSCGTLSYREHDSISLAAS